MYLSRNVLIMNKKALQLIFSSLVLSLAFVGFSPSEEVVVLENLKVDTHQVAIYPKAEAPAVAVLPVVVPASHSLVAFQNALGFKESQNRYDVVNVFGYMGRYQFGIGTLRLLGIQDRAEFLANAELQEAAFQANLSRNKWVLRKDIRRSVGRVINGVRVTESGILAAAHLAGPGAVKKYLRSGGSVNFEDGYGTTIRSYMRKFKGYDTSCVPTLRRPKVAVV